MVPTWKVTLGYHNREGRTSPYEQGMGIILERFAIWYPFGALRQGGLKHVGRYCIDMMSKPKRLR